MDDNEDKQPSRSVNLKRYLLTLIVIWTLGVAFSLGWNSLSTETVHHGYCPDKRPHHL